jgi:hypothetical protein
VNLFNQDDNLVNRYREAAEASKQKILELQGWIGSNKEDLDNELNRISPVLNIMLTNSMAQDIRVSLAMMSGGDDARENWLGLVQSCFALGYYQRGVHDTLSKLDKDTK